jgi:single-stranded DNA-specific DHH superfamily exonuclease
MMKEEAKAGTRGGSHAAASAMQKMEKLFETLNEEEREIVSEMVRAALIQAAELYDTAEQAIGYSFPRFVSGITGQHAPTLVKSLRLPGSLAAHSIPSCASSGLAAIRAEFRGGDAR